MGALLLLLAIWVARRPDQLMHPYVWVEESFVIESWQDGGFLEAAFSPIQGQLVLATSFTSSLILSFAFLDYPVMAYLAATGWFIGTALLWLLPGSRLSLELRVALAIAPALAPAGPETFGVLLYSFWWVSLWPASVLFWDSPKWGLRIPVLLVAGLSSLAASSLFIAFGSQWWLRRRREDAASALLLLTTLVLQAVVYFTSDRAQETAVSILNIAQQMFVNIGEYPIVWLDSAQFHYLLFVGIAAVLGALTLAWHSRRKSPEFVSVWIVLLLILAAFTVLSSIPAAKASEPVIAGARYYFLPFIAVSWLAIALFTAPWKKATTVAVAILVAGSVSLAPTFTSRTQDTLSWKSEVRKGCDDSGGVGAEIPVHYDGVLEHAWSVSLDEATCSQFDK